MEVNGGGTTSFGSGGAGAERRGQRMVAVFGPDEGLNSIGEQGGNNSVGSACHLASSFIFSWGVWNGIDGVIVLHIICWVRDAYAHIVAFFFPSD
jgi:hypothetical protein